MAAATLEQIVDAAADQIRTFLSPVTDITVHVETGFFRSAEMPAVNVYPGPPAGATGTGLAGYGDLYGGRPLLIRAIVSPADIEAGESLLWALMDDVGELSLIRAIAEDPTLGGAAFDLSWGEWSELRDFSPPDQDGRYVGAVLPIVVAKAHS